VRDLVGWLDTPGCRLAIRPKVGILLGVEMAFCSEGAIVESALLLDRLARECAQQLQRVWEVGLVKDYQEGDTQSAHLRGRLRVAEQSRRSLGRCASDFSIIHTSFDLDTPCNRIPLCIGRDLLRHPSITPVTKAIVRAALEPLEPLDDSPLDDSDFEAAKCDTRAGPYRSLLALCHLPRGGLTATGMSGRECDAFLIDLRKAFEKYLAWGVNEYISCHTGWSAEIHPLIATGASTLRPDVLFRYRGVPRVVLDAKWKASGKLPDASDLHQILAYAAITRARHVGLVYPGRRYHRKKFIVPESRIVVSLFRTAVVGTSDECSRSLCRRTTQLCSSR
jgi:5-methylcytosine-specific restriction enzyme subunit McrC